MLSPKKARSAGEGIYGTIAGQYVQPQDWNSLINTPNGR
jgi:hypothetical protein